MRYIKYISVILIVSLLFSDCVDPIDFEIEREFKDAIVIQGRVVKSPGDSFVELTINRLFDFTLESRIPVSVQQATLFDNKGNEMELTTRSPGVYKIPLDETTPVQAEEGTFYHVRVRTLDGRTFESTPEVLISTIAPDDLQFDVTQVERLDQFNNLELLDRLQISVNTRFDRASPGGLFWEIREIFRVTDLGINDEVNGVKTCYVDQFANVNQINTLDPRTFSVDEVTEFPLLTAALDGSLAEGKYYEVRQYSLSQGAFAYWNAIDILSERDGSVFDGPVGEVPTNFSNTENTDDAVFGYFYASEEQLIRERVPSILVENLPTVCESVRACFGGPGGSCICGICCDCLDDPNSSLETSLLVDRLILLW